MRSRGRGCLLPISLFLLALLQLHAVAGAAHRQQQADTAGAALEAAPEAFTPEQVSALGTSFASQLAEALADSSSEEEDGSATASIAAAAGTAGWFSELKKELDQQQEAVDFNKVEDKKMHEYYRGQDKYYSSPSDHDAEHHSEQHAGGAYEHEHEPAEYHHKKEHHTYDHKHADAYDGGDHSDHAYKPEHNTYSGGHDSDSEGEHAYKHPEEHHAYGEEADHQHHGSSYPHNGYDSDEDEGYGPHHEEEEEACMQETARTNCVAGESTDAGIPAPITYKSTVGCCTEPYGQSYYYGSEGRDWYGDDEYKHSEEEGNEYKPSYHHEHSDDEDDEDDEHYYRHPHHGRHHHHTDDEHDTYPYAADRSNATAELAYFGGDSLFDFAEAKPECVWSLAYHAPVPIKKNMEQIGLASAVCHFPKGPNSLEHKCGEELLCEGMSFKIQADIYSTYAISKHLPSSNLDSSCQALVPNDGARKKQQQRQQQQQPLQQPLQQQQPDKVPTPPTQKANNKPTAAQGPNGIWMPGHGAAGGQPWLRGEKDQIWNKWSNSRNQQQQQQAPQQPAAQPAPAPQQQPAPQAAAPKQPEPVAAAPAPTPAAAALPKPIPAAQDAPAKPVTAPVAPKPVVEQPKAAEKPAPTAPVAEQPKAAPAPEKKATPVPVATPQPATTVPAAAPQVPAAAAPQKPATAAPETPKAAAPQVPPVAAAAPQKPATQEATTKPAWYTKVAEPVAHPPAWITRVPEPSVRPAAAPKKAAAAEVPAAAAVPAKPAAQPEQKPAAATPAVATPAPVAPQKQQPAVQQPATPVVPPAAVVTTPAAPAAAKQPQANKPAAAVAGRRLSERLEDADEASVGTAQFFIDTPGSLHAKKAAPPQARPNQQRPAAAHPSRQHEALLSGPRGGARGPSHDDERHHEERHYAEEAEEQEERNSGTPHPLFSGLEDLSNDLLAGPTGLYYGKTTIIAGRIKAISGSHKDYSHGVVEHILSFNGEPVTESALRELHDTPHVKPGAYKLVFFKDSEEYYH